MIKSSTIIKSIGIIMVLISIILIVTFQSNSKQDISDPMESYSNDTIKEWENLLDNGIGSKLDISAVDKDIKVTAEGVIGDDFNTLVLIKIEDLKGESKYSIDFNRIDLDRIENYPIKISGDMPERYLHERSSGEEPVYTTPSYSTLYSQSKKFNRVILSTTEIDGDEGNIHIDISRLSTMVNNAEESPISVAGNWNLQIPVKKINAKQYHIDKTIQFDGNEVIIQKITMSPTKTIVDSKIKKINEEKGYNLENVTFSIRHGLKKYGSSTFPSTFSTTGTNQEYIDMRQILESIYLESPDKIQLIIESCEYFVEDEKIYDIHIDNLPQIIEYNGSNITIEDIVHNEDFSEVIIKEDTSKDRKYIFSYLSIISEDNPNESTGSRLTDYELRDKKGRLVESYKKDAVWAFFKEQRVILEDDTQLSPNKIRIKGQSYIGYPNVKTSILLR